MKLICANFKMNLLEEDIINYLDVIENKIDKNNTVFFPSNLYLKHFLLRYHSLHHNDNQQLEL